MIEVSVYSHDGNQLDEKVLLDERIFLYPVNYDLLYLDTRAIMANRRSGTHKTKERSEVHGSTRKLRPQKHLGRARVGSITNPIFRHGGTVFGPRPRKYYQKVNKKAKLLARISALSYIYKNSHMRIIKDIQLTEIKTRNIAQIINNLGFSCKESRVLLVTLPDEKIRLSTRNLPAVSCTTPHTLNTYDMLSARAIIFTKSSILTLQEELLTRAQKYGIDLSKSSDTTQKTT